MTIIIRYILIAISMLLAVYGGLKYDKKRFDAGYNSCIVSFQAGYNEKQKKVLDISREVIELDPIDVDRLLSDSLHTTPTKDTYSVCRELCGLELRPEQEPVIIIPEEEVIRGYSSERPPLQLWER